MKTIATITFGAILAAGSLLPATAKDAAPLPDCVVLSDAHQGTRGTEGKQLLLKDGDAHYRVAFDRTCQVMSRSSVQVQTDGQANLLCPSGSSVHAANRRCEVQSVDRIDATAYERQARINRRR